jgi:pimeloyl-ACP methyl ester carboxylesterase
VPIIGKIRYVESILAPNALTPVILIHGAGSDHSIWPPPLRRMNGLRVITIDLPGHGGSPGAVPSSVIDYANKIWVFLNAMGIYHVVLIGHSLGGVIALEMALLEPERISALILLGVSLHPPYQPELCARLDRPADISRTLAILEKNLFSPNCDPALKKRIMQSLVPSRISLLCADWHLALEHKIPEDLHTIKCPVLVLAGQDDRLTPVGSDRGLANSIPGAQFQVVQKAGHSMILEQSEEVAQRITRFLGQFAKQKRAGNPAL